MNIEQTIPFFWVMDVEKSLRFYTNQLGFEIRHQWINEGKLRWCSLHREGANLMVQEFWKDGPHANLPKGKLGEGVSIYFICQDALTLYKEFKSNNVDASLPFVGNAMWVTGMRDPDGYNLYFESATDVPEETVYVEEP
ncbi:MAG: VOC family protein [Chitinophagales bacterium]